MKIRRRDVSAALDLLSTLDSGRHVDNMTVEDYDYGQFTDQLNTDLCFAIGHSFGGGTVIQTLHEDKRFRYNYIVYCISLHVFCPIVVIIVQASVNLK